MSEDNDQEKTEEPSYKRLEDARNKGQIYQSREVNSFLLLFTFALIMGWSLPDLFVETGALLTMFITQPDMIVTGGGGMQRLLSHTFIEMSAILAMPLLALMVAAIAGSVVQKPLILSAEPIIPKWEKISLTKGLKRLFSMRSVVEFLKGIVKIVIVGIIATMAVWPDRKQLLRLADTEMHEMLLLTHEMVMNMLIGILVALFFIALIDYIYQRYDYMKNLRMTKQEVRDEYKQQEGDPVIKQRIRALRMERARKRMMANVPTADVVITNPTHYAVALQYDSDTMNAPKIVAKGQDKVALKIREVAKENNVPIVENPPLARALYPSNLDEEVPLEHYKAVAAVISYVYKMKGKAIRPRTK
jgi:flagellar biosynthetic protein FlhB